MPPRGVYVREGKSTDVNVQSSGPDIEIPLDGVVKREDLVAEVEPVHNLADFDQKAQMLAFLEEPVEIFLHESTNPNEEPVVFLQVSGEPAQPGNPYLIRGKQYTVKRKFVEQLVRAKTVSYSQPFKGELNDNVNSMRPHIAMRYPFSVVRDANPKGGKWLSQLMAA